MCFFVGNDFLPHLPSLNIRDGGIDILMFIYECVLARMPDYLINSGIINYKSLEIFLGELARVEDRLVEEAIKRENIMRQRDFQNKNPRGNMNMARGDSNREEYPGANKKVKNAELLQTPLEQFKQELKDINPE